MEYETGSELDNTEQDIHRYVTPVPELYHLLHPTGRPPRNPVHRQVRITA